MGMFSFKSFVLIVRRFLIFSEAKDFAVLGEKSVKGKREMYTIGA